MNTIKTLAACAAIATLSGCASVSSPVGNGGLFTSVKGPVAVTNADKSMKKGHACATNVLGLVAVGDASTEAAKKNGGIKTVASVDHTSTTVLGLFGTYCTNVSGS